MAHAIPPELELAFWLSGVASRRAAARARVRLLAGRCHASTLADVLARRRLLPLIGSRLREAAPEGLPEGFGETVDVAVREARAAAMALETLTRRLLARLDDAGIAAVSLKGPLMAERLYGDVGLRQAADVDLLVAPADLSHAVEVVRRDGYGPPVDPVGGDGLPDLHFRLHGERLPSVELHWRIHWYEDEFSRDYLRRAGGGDPEPLDELLSLLLYYARDGFHGLRAAADIAAWVDRYGEPASLARAHQYPALLEPLQAAAIVAERMTGARLTLPLRVGRPTVRVRVATRLADWAGLGERDQLAANIALVDGVLTPPGDTRAFAQRLARLDPAVEAAIPSRATLLARRAVHTAKMTFRFALALWAIRRGRRISSVPARSGRV
jgi:hypothetical protein